MLLSLSQVPASIAYPSYSVGSIVLVALAGVILFKEKISRRRLIALAIIMVALAMLNM
jgi:multidrug transporter EmrE-like cation transporter